MPTNVELAAQVRDLTDKFEAAMAQMDNDTGITFATYGANHDVESNNPATVQNVSKNLVQPGGTMVTFDDAFGKRWVVKPGQIITANGVTAKMRKLETRGYLSIS